MPILYQRRGLSGVGMCVAIRHTDRGLTPVSLHRSPFIDNAQKNKSQLLPVPSEACCTHLDLGFLWKACIPLIILLAPTIRQTLC